MADVQVSRNASQTDRARTCGWLAPQALNLPCPRCKQGRVRQNKRRPFSDLRCDNCGYRWPFPRNGALFLTACRSILQPGINSRNA